MLGFLYTFAPAFRYIFLVSKKDAASIGAILDALVFLLGTKKGTH
jgi:hypothetical protein